MKKVTIIILGLSAIMLGILLGIITSGLKDAQIQSAQVNEIKKLNVLIENNEIKENYIKDDIIETNQSNIKLSPNAIIVFEKNYTECGHTIIQKEQIEDGEVNKTKEYFEEAYSDWNIKSFTQNEVKLYKQIDDMCDEHYLITVNDENIVVYVIDSDGNTNLLKETDIPVQYLSKEDIELLEKGITANGQNELAKKLEDYE